MGVTHHDSHVIPVSQDPLRFLPEESLPDLSAQALESHSERLAFGSQGELDFRLAGPVGVHDVDHPGVFGQSGRDEFGNLANGVKILARELQVDRLAFADHVVFNGQFNRSRDLPNLLPPAIGDLSRRRDAGLGRYQFEADLSEVVAPSDSPESRGPALNFSEWVLADRGHRMQDRILALLGEFAAHLVQSPFQLGQSGAGRIDRRIPWHG